MDTEADPNIMGPAAPMGTSGPWDSQSETMVVRNMAGKTEIIPEMNGNPIDAIHTEAPIAKPAAVPLTNKTPQPTAFFPAGAVGFDFTATNPKTMEADVVVIAIIRGSIEFDVISTMDAEMPAKMAHRATDNTETAASRVFPFNRPPNHMGEFLHIPKKSRFRSMPTGTIDMAAEKDSSDPTSDQIPRLAGTIVVGRVMIPPIAPPPRSTKTVDMIATSPAKTAGIRMLMMSIAMKNSTEE